MTPELINVEDLRVVKKEQRIAEAAAYANARLTPEEISEGIRRGYEFGSSIATNVSGVIVAARQPPFAKRLDSAEFNGVDGFQINGPFAEVMGIYIRNPTDGVYAFKFGDAAGGITVGAEAERHFETSTPTDSLGYVNSVFIIPEVLVAPSAHGTVYFEVEP